MQPIVVGMSTPPIPSYVTQRLFGVELEVLIIGSGNYPDASTIPGWDSQTDASIGGGKEYIFKNPTKWAEALGMVHGLCEKLRAPNKLKLSKSGALHVHVSAEDFTEVEGAFLANMYQHFRPVIDELVGPSRRGRANHFCIPFDSVVTPEWVRSSYLNDGPYTRADCKARRNGGAGWFAVSLAYLGAKPRERSIEFRQGSVSTRSICILGWMQFVAVLTDAAKAGRAFDSYPATLSGLVDYVTAQGNGSETVSTWLRWRHGFMNTVTPGSRLTAKPKILSSLGTELTGTW